ncbi:MAG: DUF4190 domain-containing protein [Akkermansiaceae bacterium]
MSASDPEEPPAPGDSQSVPPPVPAQQQPIAPYPGSKPMGQDAGTRLLLPVGRSIWAIIAGYLGLFALVVIPAPLALLTGIIAYFDIRKSQSSPNPKYGMGRAIFAIVMGSLGTVFLIVILVGAALGS